jgi:hypothetical protein
MRYYRNHSIFESEKFLSDLTAPLRDYFISEGFTNQTYFTTKAIEDCVNRIEEYQFEQKLEYLNKEIERAQGQAKLELLSQKLEIDKKLKGAKSK